MADQPQMNLARHFFRRFESLASFLAIPLAVVAMFLALAAGTYFVDESLSKKMVSSSSVLGFLKNLFGDRESTRSLLATIASAIITVTSITFSLLLVAVQQAAGSFGNQILQQFRNRRSNQFYFGFFVGLSLYTLVTLAAIRSVHLPLFGALISIVMTIVALLLILVLIYTTIEQMRGENVIDAIAGNVRRARSRELDLLDRTRRTPTPDLPIRAVYYSSEAGSVMSIDRCALEDAMERCAPEAELVLCATDGVFVGHGDRIAELRCPAPVGQAKSDSIGETVDKAFDFGSDPGLGDSPQVGISQLATIAWNNTSTAVSNPHPPMLICRIIREIVWDWTDSTGEDPGSRIVYPDLSLRSALGLLEAMTVASAESRQPQTLAEIYLAYSALLPKLGERMRARVEEAIRLSLGTLQAHYPTQHLQGAMERLAKSLAAFGSPVSEQVNAALRLKKASGGFGETASSSAGQ